MINVLRFSIWVVSVLWISAVLILTMSGYVLQREGLFVRQVLPQGTAWQGYQVAIPGYQPITISEEERLCRNQRLAELDRRNGEFFSFALPSPWACLKSIPVFMEVRWLLFCLGMVCGLLLLMCGRRPYVPGRLRPSQQ